MLKNNRGITRERRALLAIKKSMKPHVFAKRMLGAEAALHNTVFANLGQPCPWCLIETIIAEGLKR